MLRNFSRDFFAFVITMVAFVAILSPLSAQTAKVRVQPDPISLRPASIQELTGVMVSTGEVIAWGNRLKAPFTFRVNGSVVDVVSPDGVYQVRPTLGQTTMSPAPPATALDNQVSALRENVDVLALNLRQQGKSDEEILDTMANEFSKSGLVTKVCVRNELLCYTVVMYGSEVMYLASIPTLNPPEPKTSSENEAILDDVGPLMETLRKGGKVIIGDYPPIQVPPRLFGAFGEDVRNAQAIISGAPSHVINKRVAQDLLHPSTTARKER